MADPTNEDRQRLVVDLNDSQFKTSCSLHILRYHYLAHMRPLKEHHPMLKLLDWLSLFFVRAPQGDKAATALKIDPPNVTLFISLDKGAPDDEDRAMGELLLQTIHGLLDTSAMPLQQKKDKFVKLLLMHTSQRIQRKVHLLSTLLPPSSDPQHNKPGAYLLNLISDWLSQGNEEKSPWLINMAAQSNGCYQDASDALKKCVEDLWAIDAHQRVSLFSSETEDQINQSMQLFDKIMRPVRLLLGSTFLVEKLRTDFRREGDAGRADFFFLERVQRRLERIACYDNGAHAFAKRGLTILQNALQGTNARQGIRICWASKELSMPPGHGVTRIYHGTRNEIIDAFLQPSLVDFQHDHPHETDRAATNVRQLFADAWAMDDTAGITTVTPHWHCELQLITFLTERGIKIEESDGYVKKGLIGASKLSCKTCHEYLEAAERGPGISRHWKLSGTSLKPQYSWAIPDGHIGSTLAKHIDQEADDMLYNIIMDHPEFTGTAIQRLRD